jgi:peptidoglycan/xylan/chitin deacetylase (PgdA/CDA1 family)
MTTARTGRLPARIRDASSRIRGRYQRTLAEFFAQRLEKIPGDNAYVSFTFDDFPRSALETGGRILQARGLRATYYASFGLMGTHTETGDMFVADDIREVLREGHELGSHTYAHSHAWQTSPDEFEWSILRNKQALYGLVPGAEFGSFSFPKWVPKPSIKQIAARHFDACRCGGQTFNADRMDVNLLKAFFIEKSREDIASIRKLIDETCRSRGWLIFATHDISDDPTPYGCTPATFTQIVDHALASGARVLPVREALDAIRRSALAPGGERVPRRAGESPRDRPASSNRSSRLG